MWNYRIIKLAEKGSLDGTDHYYGLCETFYNDDGEICAHDETPSIVGESVDDIKKTLSLMSKDADKYEVLDGETIEFSEWETGEVVEISDIETFFESITSEE